MLPGEEKKGNHSNLDLIKRIKTMVVILFDMSSISTHVMLLIELEDILLCL